jgi:hypothetical protein
MEKEVIITSTLRHKIRLPLERWAHILESHDYMAGCVDLVVETVSYPDQLIESEWEHYALKSYDSTPVGKKTCVVIYKDIVDGFIITALLTSKQEQFVKRGRTIWKK